MTTTPDTTSSPDPQPGRTQPRRTQPGTSAATVLGYPRQGPDRELKKAIESYWKGTIDGEALQRAVTAVRRQRLITLRDAGLAEVPVGDFSLYDHVLDTSLLLGAVPARFDATRAADSPIGRLDLLFAMARGDDSAPPLEMTKWFDTNYHYLVPELGPATSFTLDPEPLLAEVAEARALGLTPRAVLLGPVSYLLLAKASVDGSGFDPLTLLEDVLPLYEDLLGRLAAAGVAWVQLDEPTLVQGQPQEVLQRFSEAYARLTAAESRPQIIVASYFEQLDDALDVVLSSGVEGLSVDLTGAARADLDRLLAHPGLADKRVLAGVVDGRNVWRTDLGAALAAAETLAGKAGRVDISSSCSLLHVPIDVARESGLDPEVAGWLAFADQKLVEIATLTTGLREGRDAIAAALDANRELLESRRASEQVINSAVRDRAAAVTEADRHRDSDYASRAVAQRANLSLPALPTTTVGSFPQTSEIRRARADLRAGRIDSDAYDTRMRAEIAAVIELQEEQGVDVLVHGEPERNDMVQYFAEQLRGFASTQHGWVQSYGTRCVRPPIIFGDVSRPHPMTIRWAEYAQGLTDRPVKGMLTGPVTMLAWSFVRDDQPQADTARQVALALRDEVTDLESTGISVIQVDEPALRETLPLREESRAAYLDWAVEAFQLTTAGVLDSTQVHTHMCYAEFADIVAAIIAMDADVISLEAARSRMEIIADLAAIGYPREVGPGVWDIHSPRVPSVEEITAALRVAVGNLPAERVWVNPDCGLKTRGYAEVTPSLANLVAAAVQLRAELASAG
ncbi:MAG: 5-methyltetrahydropteroyltriglutamate--homocysteine S-methyltransferase [Propionibacteriaceae bacterium]